MTPLDGMLVADFSRVLAGPLATMTLADLGATVVKVERPGTGDETRSWGPPWTATSSSYFECVNRGKLGIALDLGSAADRAAALELARRADVVVQNLPGIDRFGLGYDAVAAINPRVVYCSITGFGPAVDRPGYDFLVQAMGGLMSVTGDPGGEPRKVGVALVDVLTGKDAVIGILAAVQARTRTGRGDHVQVSLLSSLLGGLVNQAAGYLTTGVAPGRMGNQLLEAALAADTAASWEQRLSVAGVPAALVGDIGSAFARAAAYGLEPTVEVGTVRQVRHPVRYRESTTAVPTSPPALGQHTDAVRAWLTGPDDAPLSGH